jgi:hypothetical protein
VRSGPVRGVSPQAREPSRQPLEADAAVVGLADVDDFDDVEDDDDDEDDEDDEDESWEAEPDSALPDADVDEVLDSEPDEPSLDEEPAVSFARLSLR